jgi:Na+/H+ antiporter NhaD/arsenite permease-like protein
MEEHSFVMPLWALIPFALMLIMIAVAPLLWEHWWEKNKNKLLISFVLSVPTAIFLIINGFIHELEHQIMYDYVPFIVLLSALYVISGGLYLTGNIQAKPKINTLFMAIGYVLASIMGTTGAAMLLIRPLITTNSLRKYKTHTILFFIATVANAGGLLTPLGDPPLFLLYLRGAEFGWFFHMLPEWLFVGTTLIGLYYLIDRRYYKKEDPKDLEIDSTNVEPIRIGGGKNFYLLAGVVLCVAFVNVNYIPEMGRPEAALWLKYLREIILFGFIFISMNITKKKTRELKGFSWTPIYEVAALFLGIFITMIPALIYLKDNAASFGLSQGWQFYYMTGALSSFLDNAPTAVAIHGVALGLVQQGAAVAQVAGVPEILLTAISMGAVFFGSMTYIGNGPNFMVKAIAESSGIKMPSFFGYMLKFSLIILLPIYILTQLLFL